MQNAHLPLAVLDAIPNPVLVKDETTRYVWVNRSFERLFGVVSDDLVGRLDAEVFRERQAAQCNGGDLRVLASGETDEAEETVYDPELGPRETITRKQRLEVGGVRYLVGVIHDVTEVVQKNEQLMAATAELQRLASTDPLTGCLNRRSLIERATDQDRRAVGVVALDLDHFKAINDRYGHETGDLVLMHFADIVRDVIRDDDLFARIGGEEFLVLLPGATEDDTRSVATRVCEAVAATPLETAGGTVDATVSVGALHCIEGAAERPLEELLREADARLYCAKENGRNQVVMA